MRNPSSPSAERQSRKNYEGFTKEELIDRVIQLEEEAEDATLEAKNERN